MVPQHTFQRASTQQRFALQLRESAIDHAQFGGIRAHGHDKNSSAQRDVKTNHCGPTIAALARQRDALELTATTAKTPAGATKTTGTAAAVFSAATAGFQPESIGVISRPAACFTAIEHHQQ